jgi:hypothetical protein
MGDQLTILFTNIWLKSHGGSEVVVRDIAIGALRRGHRPIVYTPAAGDFARELRGKGVVVIEDLRMLARPSSIGSRRRCISRRSAPMSRSMPPAATG